MFRGPDGSRADRGDKEETDDFYSLPRAQEAVNVPFAKWHWVAPASQKAFCFPSLTVDSHFVLFIYYFLGDVIGRFGKGNLHVPFHLLWHLVCRFLMSSCP